MWELNSLWQTLTEDERKALEEHVEIVRYEKNEVIHYDGDESAYMWILLEGKVVLG